MVRKPAVFIIGIIAVMCLFFITLETLDAFILAALFFLLLVIYRVGIFHRFSG
ncbi:MAG TPA: hypothetical protein VGB38_06940 [bacterium]